MKNDAFVQAASQGSYKGAASGSASGSAEDVGEVFRTKLEYSMGTLARELEALGEALLEVGHPQGWGPPCVSKEKLQQLVAGLTHHAESFGACATVVDTRVVPWSEAHVDGDTGREDLHVADVLVRRKAGQRSPVEIRVAVIGNVDSGKSTMVGVLTRSMLDDGRGGARSKVMKHNHETSTGRTSSVG